MRRLPFVLAAAPCLLLLAAPAFAAPDLPLPEYRDLIGRARDAAQQKRLSPDRAADLSRELRAVKGVTLPGGSRVPVDLKAEADDFARIAGSANGGRPPYTTAERLSALSDQLSARRPAAAPAQSGGDPAKLASAILAEDQFRIEGPDDKPRPNLKWWEKAMDAVGKGLEKFFRWLFRNRSLPNAPTFGWQGVGDIVLFVLYFLASVAATVALYFLGRWALREFGGARFKRPKKDAVGTTGLDLTDEGITDPLGTAREMAARGEYRGAVRLVYIASLHRLAGNGLLVLEQNRTNWEYQRALRSESPEAYGTLLPATRLFDRVWYGKVPTSAAEYEAVVTVYERLGAYAAGTSVPLDRGLTSQGGVSQTSGVHSSEIGPSVRNNTASAAPTTSPRAEGATQSSETLAPAAQAKKENSDGSNPW